MKKFALSVLAATGILVFVVLVAFVAFSVMENSARMRAKSEILAAVDRMRSAENFDDAGALLRLCKGGVDQIECGLGNTTVLYRGHRIPFDLIEVSYHRPLHRPLTGVARIHRRPQVEVMQLD